MLAPDPWLLETSVMVRPNHRNFVSVTLTCVLTSLFVGYCTATLLMFSIIALVLVTA